MVTLHKSLSLFKPLFLSDKIEIVTLPAPVREKLSYT